MFLRPFILASWPSTPKSAPKFQPTPSRFLAVELYAAEIPVPLFVFTRSPTVSINGFQLSNHHLKKIEHDSGVPTAYKGLVTCAQQYQSLRPKGLKNEVWVALFSKTPRNSSLATFFFTLVTAIAKFRERSQVVGSKPFAEHLQTHVRASRSASTAPNLNLQPLNLEPFIRVSCDEELGQLASCKKIRESLSKVVRK
ncbi:hypothetical protein K438DRAFT_1770543 [Mycena galopus ATCC 62051]|nr:hypothetical protein K438DRAFT_1770543 [Mycena galopus ATCC 62051]